MTVGQRIRQKRIELGLSQDELGRQCGYKSRSSINKIELSRDLPLSKVEKVAKVLGCSPSELMGWTDEEVYDKPDEKIIADFIFDRVKNKYIRKLYETLGDITEEEGEELIRYAEFIKSRRGKK